MGEWVGSGVCKWAGWWHGWVAWVGWEMDEGAFVRTRVLLREDFRNIWPTLKLYIYLLLACQSGIQSYGLPSGYTPLQHLLQNTSISWTAKQDLCCVWCKFCRWSTYKEKSARTLDFLWQWTYYLEEQPTTYDSSLHNRGWTWQLCQLRQISPPHNEDIWKHGFSTGTWARGTQEPNM